MAKFDFTNIKATADRLIDRFGAEVTLRCPQHGGDPWNPTVTNQDTPVQAVDLGNEVTGYRRTGELKESIGGNVAIEERMFFVAIRNGDNLIPTPKRGDLIVTANEELEITEIEIIQPSGDPIAYQVTVKT